ncbi:MAG: hypothetical protein Q9159_001943 [Coniocarpon cinnabarinum]
MQSQEFVTWILDNDQIHSLLLSYRDGLNTASVKQCVSLYASNGICMPQHQSASTGTQALTTCYEGFFAMLKFNVQFDIKEVHVLTSEWAFARTTSQGTTTFVQSGVESREANQELFVLRKEGGVWKIASVLQVRSLTNVPTPTLRKTPLMQMLIVSHANVYIKPTSRDVLE